MFAVATGRVAISLLHIGNISLILGTRCPINPRTVGSGALKTRYACTAGIEASVPVHCSHVMGE